MLADPLAHNRQIGLSALIQAAFDVSLAGQGPTGFHVAQDQKAKHDFL